MAEAAKDKATVAYFKCLVHPGLIVSVYKEEKLPLGGVEQVFVREARFVQYYDIWKGDVIRVGFLATDDAEIVKRLENDLNVVAIEKKEYDEATHPKKGLRRAPVPAA